MYRFCLAVLLALFASATPQAKAFASDQPVSVAVQCACNDEAGKAYLSAVRQTVGKQAGFKLQSSNEIVSDDTLVIRVISTGYKAKDRKSHSMLSVVVTYNGATMNEVIDASCDLLSAKESAQSTVDGLQDLL